MELVKVFGILENPGVPKQSGSYPHQTRPRAVPESDAEWIYAAVCFGVIFLELYEVIHLV